MTLADQVAIVTGGACGLGKRIAMRLAQEGAAVVLAAPEEDELEHTAGEIRGNGGRALPVQMDITKDGQVSQMVARTKDELGRIDILVNNSGNAGPTAPVHDVDRADWDETLAVNLTGMFLCSKAVLPEMIARGGGKVINISSIGGRIGYKLRSPYAVSKWGVIGLTLTVASEVGEHNIQVNAICPGPIEGDRTQAVFEDRARELGQSVDEVQQNYLDQMALKRLVQPDDVAAMVAFLASSEADNITGQAIDVSAGWRV